MHDFLYVNAATRMQGTKKIAVSASWLHHEVNPSSNTFHGCRNVFDLGTLSHAPNSIVTKGLAAYTFTSTLMPVVMRMRGTSAFGSRPHLS